MTAAEVQDERISETLPIASPAKAWISPSAIRRSKQILIFASGLLLGWIGTSAWDGLALSSVAYPDGPWKMLYTANELASLRLDSQKYVDDLESSLDRQIESYPAWRPTLQDSRCLKHANPLSVRLMEWTLGKVRMSPDPLMIAKAYREHYPSSGELAPRVETILDTVNVDEASMRSGLSAVARLSQAHKKSELVN